MKLQNWESILAAEIAAGQQQTFEWGRHDCVTWALGVVAAITGRDYRTEILHPYTSAFGAGRAIKMMGPDLPSCFDMFFKRISVSFAKRGDLLYFQGAMGICEGTYSYFASNKGLAVTPTLKCIAAWRVE